MGHAHTLLFFSLLVMMVALIDGCSGAPSPIRCSAHMPTAKQLQPCSAPRFPSLAALCASKTAALQACSRARVRRPCCPLHQRVAALCASKTAVLQACSRARVRRPCYPLHQRVAALCASKTAALQACSRARVRRPCCPLHQRVAALCASKTAALQACSRACVRRPCCPLHQRGDSHVWLGSRGPGCPARAAGRQLRAGANHSGTAYQSCEYGARRT